MSFQEVPAATLNVGKKLKKRKVRNEQFQRNRYRKLSDAFSTSTSSTAEFNPVMQFFTSMDEKLLLNLENMSGQSTPKSSMTSRSISPEPWFVSNMSIASNLTASLDSLVSKLNADCAEFNDTSSLIETSEDVSNWNSDCGDFSDSLSELEETSTDDYKWNAGRGEFRDLSSLPENGPFLVHQNSIEHM